ncbi:MAG: antibiotic biosynthesis monooxygenase [Acidimicrobiales bacterium]|nr:antibiotic biosynthesis monooxygenase [Acidimicrobiales bacterium]
MSEVVTVFRSRLRADAYDNGYAERAAEMVARAKQNPGFLEHKSFTADDGERVSIVRFASQEAHEEWASDNGHREVQQQGRNEFYEEYSIQVADVRRERAWSM